MTMHPALRRAATTVLIAVASAAWSSAGGQDGGPPTTPVARAASPWETSLSLEAANELEKARVALVDAYGPRPAIYSVAVRLAWLSLRMGRAAEAIDMYARAQQLAGALPEATQGLALTLTMEGYRQLDRGDIPAARRYWREALDTDSTSSDANAGLAIVGPSSGAAPELWVGTLSATSNASSAQLIYAALPYRIDDELSVRAAYRHVGSASAVAGTTGLFGSQDELFGGVSVERGIGAAQLVAFTLTNALSTTTGAAVGGRIGGRYGATLALSMMSQTAGTNVQIVPQGFAWVQPFLALNAGVRVTHDPDVSAVSPLFGATVRAGRLELDVQSHSGTERLAFNMAGPTVMSFGASSARGVTMTGSFGLDAGRMWTMFVQAQFEQLRTSDGLSAQGSYTGLALGARWIPVR